MTIKRKVLVKSIDDYMALQSEPVMEALENLRQTIKEVAPQAEELISYNMPAMKIHGRILVYFAAFKDHCSLFVGNATLIKEFQKELKTFKTAPGTIQFTVDKPIPKSLVKKMIKIRVKQNEKKEKIKFSKKSARITKKKKDE